MKKANTKNNKKITKYRKPINANIGLILAATIVIYLLYVIFAYFNTTKMVRYEVKEGSLAVNTRYEALALRKEHPVEAAASGYINFYTYEGERVAVGDLIYTVDEAGKLNDYLMSGEQTQDLSEKNVREFRNTIENYRHNYSDTDFNTVYEFKRTMSNAIHKLANASMLKNANVFAESSQIQKVYAPNTGIVTFWTDGMEELTADQVNAACFDREEYNLNTIDANSLVSMGDIAFKYTNKEAWSIVIPMDRERAEELLREEYVKVRFLKNQYELWGQVSIHDNEDGCYVELGFTSSMVNFCTDRFVDVELMLHDEKGLKIPNSAIVQKEFFLVDQDFVNEKGEEGFSTIMRQAYLEDGTMTTETVNIDIYSFDEENGEYYIDTSLLRAGDILRRKDSQETFNVHKRATLIGVYNINKGYADFKEIKKLYENEEYSIVKPNTRYGLSVYDYIVLNAESVNDDQFMVEK